MTSKLTITREQATDKEIQMLIDSHENGTAMFLRVDAYYLMAKELQERRKAAMDSEPVAWMHNNNNIGIPAITTSQKIGQYWMSEFKDVQPLYRHAQPAPDGEQLAIENFRSAMEGIGHIRRTLEQTFGGMHGTHVEPDILAECKAICDAVYAAYSGNSPVIPDGLIAAVNRLLDSDGSRGCYSAIQCGDAHDEIERLLAAAPHDTPALNSVQSVVTVPGKWIPVSERVPENDGAYLCWDKRYVTTYAFIFGAWQANQFIAKNITHWMPLPAAPQEVKGE